MDENPHAGTPFSPRPKSERALAIAIEAGATQEAPARIVATGRGKLAEAILAVAFAHGVRVRSDADLADLLAKLELERPIPTEAIVAVAEILAKVYEANAAYAKKVPHPLTERP